MIEKPLKIPSAYLKYLNNLCLSPSALSKNLIQIKGHLFLLNQIFNLGFHFFGQNSHQGFRSKSIFCSFLVISLRHITEHESRSLVSVVDDLSKVPCKVLSSKGLKTSKSLRRNISFPLQVSFPSLYKIS